MFDRPVAEQACAEERASHFANRAVVGLGLVVLAAGALVYLVDRPTESAPFFRLVSLAHLTPTVFGKIGQTLPTFSHVFSFSLWTAAWFRYRHMPAVAACVGWCLFDMAFELGQHASVATFLSERIPPSFERFPILAYSNDYFRSGTFDVSDVISIIAGAGTAYFVTRWAAKRDVNHA
jgi:hypothetical protein